MFQYGYEFSQRAAIIPGYPAPFSFNTSNKFYSRYPACFEANDFLILRRTPTMIYVRESNVEKMGKIQDVSYEILNVLEFNRWVYILFFFFFLSHLSSFISSGFTFLTSVVCNQYSEASVRCMSLSRWSACVVL